MDQVIGVQEQGKEGEVIWRGEPSHVYRLQEQYERAMTDDKIVVFVRDNDNKKLVSYSV